MSSLICSGVRHFSSGYTSKKVWHCYFQLPRNFQTYVTRLDEIKCLKITRGHKSTNYLYFWLRDHCHCDTCYNNLTAQRRLNFTDIPVAVKPKTAHINEYGTLKVIWEDGHKSDYALTWLEDCLYENHLKRLERTYKLWASDDVIQAPIARVEHSELLKSDNCLTKLVKSLIDYGVAFVENVPVSVEGTESAAQRIAHVQNTLFGGMWEFSDCLKHKDTAYTKEGLEAHTDNTYFTEAAGLQIFQCLSHDGGGGETILVDGFKAAHMLKEQFPDMFNSLASTSVPAQYIDNGQHHIFYGPVIKLNPTTKIIEQIRFNLNDRAALILPQDRILRHYEELRTLANIIKNPRMEWKFKLNPGTVLIVDNFRVLHGRTPYTGKRKMCGCYIGRTDFLSKARVLQIL